MGYVILLKFVPCPLFSCFSSTLGKCPGKYMAHVPQEVYYNTFRNCYSLSRVGLFVSSETVAHQAPLFREFCRPVYCSGLPFPPPRDLPDPGIKPASPTWQVDSLQHWATREASIRTPLTSLHLARSPRNLSFYHSPPHLAILSILI